MHAFDAQHLLNSVCKVENSLDPNNDKVGDCLIPFVKSFKSI